MPAESAGGIEDALLFRKVEGKRVRYSPSVSEGRRFC